MGTKQNRSKQGGESAQAQHESKAMDKKDIQVMYKDTEYCGGNEIYAKQLK